MAKWSSAGPRQTKCVEQSSLTTVATGESRGRVPCRIYRPSALYFRRSVTRGKCSTNYYCKDVFMGSTSTESPFLSSCLYRFFLSFSFPFSFFAFINFATFLSCQAAPSPAVAWVPCATHLHSPHGPAAIPLPPSVPKPIVFTRNVSLVKGGGKVLRQR